MSALGFVQHLWFTSLVKGYNKSTGVTQEFVIKYGSRWPRYEYY